LLRNRIIGKIEHVELAIAHENHYWKVEITLVIESVISVVKVEPRRHIEFSDAVSDVRKIQLHCYNIVKFLD